jgi:tetratricopeptide (TPR) repeat protein
VAFTRHLGTLDKSEKRRLQEGKVAADSKAKLLEDAERFVLHGKLQQAIGEYLKVIKQDPRDVLILNTVGDLYLRQNNGQEANKYFSQVAESYVQNNFFLKAIAVYKKILSTDPDNLEINSMMASLFAKQGLSIDARTQYLRVASLLEKDGRTKETLDAYEKIVEIDPSNWTIQRKLAEMHLAEGKGKKAHEHWAGAARAQAKAGDFQGAADSFSKAMQLVPVDVDSMRGFLECSMKMQRLEPAIEQLKKSIEKVPENIDLREMLGQAYLNSGDAASAAKAFKVVVSLDESRYESFFPVAQALIEKDEYDQTLSFLDAIIPALITRRETERAAKLYELILQRHPKHIPTLTKLASICSACGDQPRYLAIMDIISDEHLSAGRPIEALEMLEKIIQADPESDKHRRLHHQAFTEAYPDTPYVPPKVQQEATPETAHAHVQGDSEASAEEGQSEIVEADLLLNYGLKDKALRLLQTLEERDPYDREVRVRLLNIYKAEKKHPEAAEQCLLLAALHRRAKNETSAQSYLAEAKQLDPDLAEYEADLDDFARQNGILMEDLLDIFFAGDEKSTAEEASDAQEIQEDITEGYTPDISSRPPSRTIEEQLQEVDFYIRLGFNDEAIAKLNEIAKISPNNPELALRYEKLGGMEQTPAPEPSQFQNTLQPDPDAMGTASADVSGDFQLLRTDDDALPTAGNQLEKLEIGRQEQAGQRFASGESDFAALDLEELQPQMAVSPESEKSDARFNEMFADLMEEVGDSEQASARVSFEEHFSLGTAYRDMELIEEAIKEFQYALKTIDIKRGDQKVIQCCGMLSTCFLKKNMPRSALRWCQTGLQISDISSHEAMALRYDMGVAHSMAGNSEQALACFDNIFSMDPSYRDVAQRIDELKGGFERHAPYP